MVYMYFYCIKNTLFIAAWPRSLILGSFSAERQLEQREKFEEERRGKTMNYGKMCRSLPLVEVECAISKEYILWERDCDIIECNCYPTTFKDFCIFTG